MRKLKLWLFERYFPAMAKVELAKLRQEKTQLRVELDRLNAFVDGMEAGIRLQRRITIKNEVTSNGHLNRADKCIDAGGSIQG